MFNLSSSADKTGITTMGEIEVSPASIVRRFGAPSMSDAYKVSGEYAFTDQGGQLFVVHDWKSTSLWEIGLLSPPEFWASEQPQEFCVSSHDLDISNFAKWFVEQLQ